MPRALGNTNQPRVNSSCSNLQGPLPPTWLIERTASSSGRRRDSDRPALQPCCKRWSRSAGCIPCWAQERARHMAAEALRAGSSLWSCLDLLPLQLLQLCVVVPIHEIPCPDVQHKTQAGGRSGGWGSRGVTWGSVLSGSPLPSVQATALNRPLFHLLTSGSTLGTWWVSTPLLSSDREVGSAPACDVSCLCKEEAGWQALLPEDLLLGEEADRIDHLSVHEAMGNSVAKLVEEARALWKYAILEQFLG